MDHNHYNKLMNQVRAYAVRELIKEKKETDERNNQKIQAIAPGSFAVYEIPKKVKKTKEQKVKQPKAEKPPKQPAQKTGRKKHKKERYCLNCEKKSLLRHQKNYCSRDCWTDHKKRLLEGSLKLCEQCKVAKVKESRNKYCSKRCSSLASITEKECLNCRKTFLANLSSYYFCSQKCHDSVKL